MKLNDLAYLLDDETQVWVFDRDDKYIAKYDEKDSIPAILNDAEVKAVSPVDNYLYVHLNYVDNTQAVYYLKGRLDDIVENIAIDDGYYFDVPETVNAFIANELDNIVADIREIQRNLNSNLDWNYGMYI